MGFSFPAKLAYELLAPGDSRLRPLPYPESGIVGMTLLRLRYCRGTGSDTSFRVSQKVFPEVPFKFLKETR